MLRRYSFAWVTAAFFAFTFVGHWLFGWLAYVNQQEDLGLSPDVQTYLVEATRDTLENWQSEFLQLIWQVAGLAIFIYHGSPQSKDSQGALEAAVEDIQRKVDCLCDRELGKEKRDQ